MSALKLAHGRRARGGRRSSLYAQGDYRVSARTVMEAATRRAAVAPFNGYLRRRRSGPATWCARGRCWRCSTTASCGWSGSSRQSQAGAVRAAARPGPGRRERGRRSRSPAAQIAAGPGPARADRRSARAHAGARRVRRRGGDGRPEPVARLAGRARAGALRGRAARRLPRGAPGGRARHRRRDGRAARAAPARPRRRPTPIAVHGREDHAGVDGAGGTQLLPGRGAPGPDAPERLRPGMEGVGKIEVERRLAGVDLDAPGDRLGCGSSCGPGCRDARARARSSALLVPRGRAAAAAARPRAHPPPALPRRDLVRRSRTASASASTASRPAAYQLIGLMDGQRTVQEIWEVACERLGDERRPRTR